MRDNQMPTRSRLSLDSRRANRNRKSAKKPARRRLQLETLEDRRVMATAQLSIFVDSVEQTIPASIGVDGTGNFLSQTRTLSGDGTVTIDPIASEAVTNDTLGDFFDTWRTNAGVAGNNANATFDFNTVLANNATQTKTVQMVVNGQLNYEYENYQLQDGDEVILVYGENPVISLNTNHGPIVLELFSNEVANTVDNFLNYVNDGDYDNSIFHRLDPGFVLQGGDQTTSSTTFTSPTQLTAIPSDAAIQNEFNRSNTRTTVAMARVGGIVNSATNNFFVNLADSNSSLDNVDEGFTVFAQVLDMTTVDFVEMFNLSDAIPNAAGSGLPLDDNDQLVVIQNVAGQGSVRGKKFIDADDDGVFDSGETGISGARVFADANSNGTFDAGEAFTLTDVNGDYVLQVTPGTQTIRTEIATGGRITGPASGSYTVNLLIDGEATGQDFGELVATDVNDDIVQSAIGGTAITIDVLANDVVASNATGGLTITNVTQGTANGLVVNNGSTITYTPAAGFAGTETFTYTAEDSLGTSQTATVTATSDRGEISGFVYVDNDGDGLHGASEAGVPSVLITLTGATTSGVGVTRTFMTESDGSYVFDSLPVGTYSVTERQPAALPDGLDSSDTSSATVGNDVISQLVVSGTETLANNNFGEGSLRSQYVSIHNFIVRNTSETASAELFLDRMAMAEEDAGDFMFAAEVRSGHSGEQESNTGVSAANKTYDAIEDETLTVNTSSGLLAGVTDPDGDTLTPTIVSFAANGAVDVQDDGSFTYTPTTDFVGTDSFVYRISDGTHDSSQATVTINVASANVAPVANDDGGANFTTNEDVTLTTTTSVLANDTDANTGDTLTARLLTQPATGTLTLNSDGTFTYVPVADANGTVTFTYEAFDGSLASAPATVSITITAVNDNPVADNETVGPVDEDMPLTINVADLLTGDTDVDGDTVLFDLANLGTPANGSVSETSTGVLTYTPNLNFNGTDSFTYAITDGNGGSATGTVTVQVTAVPDAPVANDDSLNVDEDTPLTITIDTDLLGGPGADTDGDGDALTFVPGSLTAASSGNLVDNSDGTLTFTPAMDSVADVTFQYAVTDGTLQSNLATVTITINPINDAPIANDDTLDAVEDTPLIIDATNDLINGTGVDTDVDVGDALSIVDLPTVDVGMVSDNGNGTYTFTPPENFTGDATLSYFVFDGTVNSALPASVTITVAAVDDTPTADDGEFTTPVNTQLSDTVSFGDVDNITSELTVVADDTGLMGTLVMQTNGDFTYTPANNFHDSEEFTFTVTDGNTTSAPATVAIFVNSLPVAVDDTLSVDEDDSITFSVQDDLIDGTGQDTDADSGDTLSLASISDVSDGTLTDNGNGTSTYTPPLNFNGDATFTYSISDGLQTSATPATVTITVNPINDAPVANDDSFLIAQNEVLTINVLDDLINANGVDTDVDGDTLSFVSFADLSSGAIVDNTGTNGTLEFTPALDTSGVVTFTYFVSDGNLQSVAPATVTITVNTPPVPADDTLNVDEDNALEIDVFADLINGNGQDMDADGDTIGFTSFTQPMSGGQPAGVISDNGNDTLTYLPLGNFHGDATFTYIINDGIQDSAVSGTVTITVAPINDVPQANDDSLTTNEDVPLVINIEDDLILMGAGTDTDDDGDTLTFVSFDDLSSGQLVETSSGVLTFTPATNATDDVTFTYIISDGTVNSDPATVTISITPVNDAPVALADTLTVVEDTPTTFSIIDDLINGTGQDSDAEGSTLEFVSFTAVSAGTFDHTPSEDAFTYTPVLNSTDDVTFTYTISDGALNSEPATVTINITPVNDAPIAVDDTLSMTEDVPLEINVVNDLINGSGQDMDVEGSTLSFVSFDNLSSGNLVETSTGVLTFTPVTNSTDDVTFTYIISDGTVNSAPATVTISITPVNDEPVANDDTLTSTNFQTVKQITVATDLLANDTDAEGTPTFAGFTNTNSADGTITANGNNTILTFTPAAGFSGNFTFTYTVTDGSLTSTPATVTIPVRDENDFEIAENSPEDTVVGNVTTSGSFTGDVVYEIESSTIPTALQLAADDHVEGNPEAKAVLIEYLDFQ